MGCRIFVGREQGVDSGPERAFLFDSVTGFAFGPMFSGEQHAESFLVFCGDDPRDFLNATVEGLWKEYCDTVRGLSPETLAHLADVAPVKPGISASMDWRIEAGDVSVWFFSYSCTTRRPVASITITTGGRSLYLNSETVEDLDMENVSAMWAAAERLAESAKLEGV